MAFAKTDLLYCAREVFKRYKTSLDAAIAVIDTLDTEQFPGTAPMDITYKMCEKYRPDIKAELYQQLKLIQQEQEDGSESETGTPPDNSELPTEPAV